MEKQHLCDLLYYIAEVRNGGILKHVYTVVDCSRQQYESN